MLRVRLAGHGLSITSILYLLLFIYVGCLLLSNQHFEWGVVFQYLFSTPVLYGVLVTLGLTFATIAAGCVLGTAIALGSQSRDVVLRGFAKFYVWVFRGVPLLVQLIFWYNIGILYPHYYLGLPHLPFLSINGMVNDLMTPVVAALLGLALNEAAYLAEIIRAGIVSIDVGQSEASFLLGMTRAQMMRRVVLPQAFRAVLPAIGNETIGTLKTTSLVSVLSIGDLLYSVQSIYARTFQVIPLLLVASIWYLLATTGLTTMLGFIERRFARHRKMI